MISTAVAELLDSVEVKDVLSDIKVKTLPNTATVREAIKMMSDNGIISIPLLDKEGFLSSSIDMLDLVIHVLSEAPGCISEPSPFRAMMDPMSIEENDLRDLKISGKDMGDAKVTECSGGSGLNPVVPLNLTDKLAEGVQLFSNGAHRSPIIDSEGKVINVVSQSSIVRLLASLFEGPNQGLTALGDQTFVDLHLNETSVYTVKQNSSVFEALGILYRTGVSALAVVDDEGVLVGNFSSTDLRFMFSEKWPSFKKSVREFLELHHHGSLHVCTLRDHNKFREAVLSMAMFRFHRVWIVDSQFKPISLVSCSDVMAVLASYYAKSLNEPVSAALKSPIDMSTPFVKLFGQRLGSIRPPHRVKTISSNDSIKKLISLLDTHHILSAPVVDNEHGCVNIIDMLDIIVHALGMIPEQATEENKLRKDLDVKAIAEIQENIVTATVSSVVGSSALNPFVALTTNELVADVITYFAGTMGVHRSPVLSDDGKNTPLAVISQSTIIRCFLEQCKDDAALRALAGQMTIKKLIDVMEWTLDTSAVKSVLGSDSLLSAIQDLYVNGTNALAVVNQGGLLSGNLSASDLRYVLTQDLTDLNSSVLDYLSKYHPKSRHCCYLKPSNTLLDICRSMAFLKIHRVYLVDDECKPIHVITCTDVMDIFLKLASTPA